MTDRKAEYDAVAATCDANTPAIRPGQVWVMHDYLTGELRSAYEIHALYNDTLPNYGRDWRGWIVSTKANIKTINNKHCVSQSDMGPICEFNLRMFYELDEGFSDPDSLITAGGSAQHALELFGEARVRLPVGAYDQEVGEPFEAAMKILARLATE